MNRSARQWWKVVFFAAVGATSAGADAQVSFFPSSVSVQVGTWTYVPVFEQSGGAAIVESVVAFSADGTTIGDNLVAVWYVRQGDSWLQKSWSEKNRWAIVQQVKGDLGISDAYDYRWGVAGTTNQSAAGEPVGVVNGVLATDPLSPMMESLSDPQPVVETLVEAGYEAVSTPTDFSSTGCSLDSMIGNIALAVSVEGALDDPSTLPVAEALANGGIQSCAGTVVTPISIKPVGPPTTWSPTRTCVPFDLGGCTFVERCTSTRTQLFLRKRTRACIIAGAYTFCDQQALLTCTEYDTCQGAPAAGTPNGDGCDPPTTLPAPSPAPCSPHGPAVPLIPPTWPLDPIVPTNCSTGPLGWVPPDSRCACP